jgi:hypothetical protein
MRRETQSGKSDYLLLAINARGLVMTSFESTIHLDFDRGFFDSAETGILSTAFEKAWASVEFDPMLGVLEASRRQSELARCLMVLLKLGDTSPTSLANSAIRTLHQRQRQKKRIVRSSAAVGHRVGLAVLSTVK